MVLGGTLRPLPSEPIAGRNPLLQGRVHRGITQARRTTVSSGVFPWQETGVRAVGPDRVLPCSTMIWVQRRTGGPEGYPPLSWPRG